MIWPITLKQASLGERHELSLAFADVQMGAQSTIDGSRKAGSERDHHLSFDLRV